MHELLNYFIWGFVFSLKTFVDKNNLETANLVFNPRNWRNVNEQFDRMGHFCEKFKSAVACMSTVNIIIFSNFFSDRSAGFV